MALQVLLAQANILIMEVPQQDNRPQVGITACEWVVLVAMAPLIVTVMVDTGVRITFHPAIRANSNKGLMVETGVEVLLLLGVNLQLVWDLLCQKDKDLRDIILHHVLHIHHSSTK